MALALTPIRTSRLTGAGGAGTSPNWTPSGTEPAAHHCVRCTARITGARPAAGGGEVARQQCASTSRATAASRRVRASSIVASRAAAQLQFRPEDLWDLFVAIESTGSSCKRRGRSGRAREGHWRARPGAGAAAAWLPACWRL